MSSNSVAAEPAKSVQKREIIVDFDPVKLRAPFSLRCGAAIIDYLIVVLVPVAGLLLSRLLGNDGAKLVNSELNNIAWGISILIALSNMILLPMVSGQSIGKMLAGIRIVAIDGHNVAFSSLVFRQTIGYLLTLLTGGLGFFFSVFSSKGRSLHDLVSGTAVVFANSQIRS